MCKPPVGSSREKESWEEREGRETLGVAGVGFWIRDLPPHHRDKGDPQRGGVSECAGLLQLGPAKFSFFFFFSSLNCRVWIKKKSLEALASAGLSLSRGRGTCVFLGVYSSWFSLSPKSKVLQLPIRALSWRVRTPPPPSFPLFPPLSPSVPFLQIQTVLSHIQTEEMFPSCSMKGVRLLSSFSRQPGRA